MRNNRIDHLTVRWGIPVLLLAFAALYLLVLCLVGGKQGVRGARGLMFTFASIIYVYLPMVYRGFSPFWTAVLICALTTVFSAFSGVLGWNVSDIENLLTLWEVNNIQVGGLLFSGLLISSLGAVMDVAMSISSAMDELCAQRPSITRGELLRAGMRVGRDMMGTDSNTLILAFVGSSASMLVLDYAYDLTWLQMINSNNIGIAVMQGLSGSFGIVLSVPATVALAAFIYIRKETYPSGTPKTVSQP